MSPPTSPLYLAVCLNPAIQRTIVLERLRRGEVNRVSELSIDASGKGINVSRVLAQLGERAVQLTQAGGHDRRLFLELARRDGIEVEAVETQAELRTCTTVLERSPGATTEIVEEGRAVEPATEQRVRDAFERLLPETHTVIISGTKAPGFSTQIYPWMTGRAKALGRTVIVDYRGDDLIATVPMRPTVIKPNFAEFARTFLAGEDPSEGAENHQLVERVREHMLRLFRDQGIVTVLTRGRFSTLYVDAGEVREERPPDVRVVNTTGSGDAFAAGMAAALAKGLGMGRAVAAGHDCAVRNAGLLRPGVIR